MSYSSIFIYLSIIFFLIYSKIFAVCFINICEYFVYFFFFFYEQKTSLGVEFVIAILLLPFMVALILIELNNTLAFCKEIDH